MTKTRYNAKIQRAKGLLELAAAMYETSLSFQTTRAAEQVLQTESRVGHALSLSLVAASREGSNSVNLSFAADSFAELKGVADGKYTLAWVNPSVAATLAYRGTGPFRKKLPLRVIATFPSYDVMGFAVHKSTGITSLAQIKKDRFPLRLSTNVTAKACTDGKPDHVHRDRRHESRRVYPRGPAQMGRQNPVGIAAQSSRTGAMQFKTEP